MVLIVLFLFSSDNPEDFSANRADPFCVGNMESELEVTQSFCVSGASLRVQGRHIRLERDLSHNGRESYAEARVSLILLPAFTPPTEGLRRFRPNRAFMFRYGCPSARAPPFAGAKSGFGTVIRPPAFRGDGCHIGSRDQVSDAEPRNPCFGTVVRPPASFRRARRQKDVSRTRGKSACHSSVARFDPI
jgi:hypothetical protein